MRIAESMDDLEIGQVIASYATANGPEELVRAGRVVGFVDHNVEVNNETGEIRKIGFTSHNTVFILADPPVDPAEEAWTEWQDGNAFFGLASYKKAFLAGWKAKGES